MGDSRRFELFASFIANQVTASRRATVRVADVAAGNGGLSFALLRQGFRNVVPFEPSPRRGVQIRRLGLIAKRFAPEDAEGFDLVVGMHPDEATDCILAGAASHGAMAIVCPCCTRPTAWTYWGSKNSRREWVEHLMRHSERIGLSLSRTALRMSGANDVIWGSPSVAKRLT